MDHRFRLGLLALSATGNGPVPAAGQHLRGGHHPAADGLGVFSLALRDEATPPALGRRIQSAPTQEYVGECQSYLLSEQVVEDGIISQAEFADMLLHQCLLNDPCIHHGAGMGFEALDLRLQLGFVNGVCHHDGPAERIQCIYDLQEMWRVGNAFGFDAEGAEVEELVVDMCVGTYEDAVALGFAGTPAPTLGPSAPPTPKPSPSPTDQPSSRPSYDPTDPPTPQPSPDPTSQPSFGPTSAPSLPPTDPPTVAPTPGPVSSPPTTTIPSFSPTSSPSNGPTVGSSIMDRIIQTPTAPPSQLEPAHSNASSEAPTGHSTFVIPYEPSKPSAQERFADQCASYLLSPPFLEDGIVSQSEFARFLIHHCIRDGMCDDRTIITFEELEVGLQLEFIFGACAGVGPAGDGGSTAAGCVDEFERDGSEFGFDASDEDLELRVREMCLMSYGYVLEMGLTETPVPTELRTPSPSASPPLTPTPSHSEKPSGSAPNDRSVNLGPPSASPKDNGSLSRGAVIGMSFVLALSATAACVVYVHHRPRADADEKHITKDASHFGIAPREHWGKSAPSLPLSYMNLGAHCSIGSSSSSFRDYRFVNVYGPGGQAIPQFNPSTASAVVIGSVTIGGSSSISSGPFGCAGSRGSTRSRSFLSFGKMSSRRNSSPKSDNGITSKDDMSSISSNRSSYGASPRHRPTRNPVWLDRRNRVKSKIPAGSHRSIGSGSRSGISRNTVPMSHRRRQKLEGRADINSQVSFGDWRAVSFMTEFRHHGGATDSSAAASQSRFFFDALLCPESTPFPPSASDWTPASVTCQSLPNMHPFARSDAGGSSILSESYFQEGSTFIQPQSVTTSTESASTSRGQSPSNDIFVPWRREGFSTSFCLSDKQSDASSSYTEQNRNPAPKRKLALLRPAKALFAKCRKKTRAKEWLSRGNRYQHLSKGIALQEDPSVISMKSCYSSHQLLLPHVMSATRADLPAPDLVLGTFAAAAMSIDKPKTPSIPEQTSSPMNSDVREELMKPCHDCPVPMDSNGGEESNANCDLCDDTAQVTKEVGQTNTPTPILHTDEAAPSPRVSIHISSLDAIAFMGQEDNGSFCAYSRSDFESSAPSKVEGWSASRSDSSNASTETSQSNSFRDVDCSFAAATTPPSKATDGCLEEVSFLSDGSNKFDPNSESDDEPQQVHLLGISQFISESASSECSISSSASATSEENQSSSTSHGTKSVQDVTNVVSPSSMPDPDETGFPSDEEIEAGYLEGKECNPLLSEHGPHPQKPSPEESAIISDDSEDLVDGETPADDPEPRPTIVLGAPNDGTERVCKMQHLNAHGKGADDINSVSFSLSWESDASKSLGTIDFDTSLASTIPVDANE